jgi:AraC-like DNA-binding protein
MVNLYEVLKNFPNLSRQLTCRDLLFTQYDCPQTEGKEKFYLECNLLVYVISGKRIVHKNRVTWDLTEGVCAFIKKGAHISERMEDDGWCVMTFFMPDHFLGQLIIDNQKVLPLNDLPEAGTDHVIPLDVNELSKSFFYSMLPYFTQTPPPPEHLLELKFKELILSLLSNNSNRSLLSYLHLISKDKNPSMEEIMLKNFSFNLSLPEYAKLTCKSVPTFKREFKKIFNDSPAKWVMKKRLNLAMQLLENSSLSISDISYECGFKNQTHFSRIFKEKTGSSPLQFRMEAQTNSRSKEIIV